MSQSVLVVGAGISGLTTAYHLRRAGADVTIMEAAPRTGGKINTHMVAGLPVDTGPDAFLARGPQLRTLIDDLGLTDEVMAPASGSYIYSRGRLRPIPPGMAFGLPERLMPLLRSGLLSPVEVARAGLDLVMPGARLSADPSIADLVRPRFGNGVYRRLVEPLLGGVHAGDPALLSARSTAGEVFAIANGQRSVYLSLRRRRAAAPPAAQPPGPPLVSLRGGLDTLRRALTASIGADRILTDHPVAEVSQTPAGWQVAGTPVDTLVLAVPAYSAADLVRPFATDLADALDAIPYVGVANATLAFRAADVPALPAGTGFLVAPVEKRFIVGCTWLTQKWPYLASDDVVLLKAMVGRSGDQRWLTMSDDQIVAGIQADLAAMLGLTLPPQEVLVQRWPRAMPQYVVGHAAALDAIDTTTPPGLHLTGAAYRGAGLAACVADGEATAKRILEGGEA